jgi:hypothetical protein
MFQIREYQNAMWANHASHGNGSTLKAKKKTLERVAAGRDSCLLIF